MDSLQAESKLLVYFYKSEGEVGSFTEPVQGQVASRILHDGRVREYVFSLPESQFSPNLKAVLEKEGLSQLCSVTSQLTPQNDACVLSVEGMTCNSCVKLIESTVSQLSGVLSIKVSLQYKEAFVEHNPNVIKPAELVQTIYDMGFDAGIVTPSFHCPMPNLPLTPEVEIKLLKLVSPGETPPLSRALIAIEGMTCSSCVQNIESNISKVRGVTSIKVSLQDKNAEVAFEQAIVTPQRLVDAIEELGFEAKLSKESSPSSSLVGNGQNAGNLKACYIGIDGMTCKSCVSLIESVVGELEGVVSISVSLPCKEATLEFNDAFTTPQAVSSTIEGMGFVVAYITGKYKSRSVWP